MNETWAINVVESDGRHYRLPELRYDYRDDAEEFAAKWNDAYPPSEGFPEFVVDEAILNGGTAT